MLINIGISFKITTSFSFSSPIRGNRFRTWDVFEEKRISLAFNPGNSTGVLGTSTEKVRVSNPTSTVAWTVSIAATGGDSAVWTDGGTNTYPYNSATGADNGRLTVDAATSGVITPASGCSATSLSKGASATFVSGTLSSITILSATTGADTYCYWDLTSVGLTQRIPASQVPASYSLGMTLSVM